MIRRGGKFPAQTSMQSFIPSQAGITNTVLESVRGVASVASAGESAGNDARGNAGG